jgi:anti-sigma regulatory factor (Ser/Thr protein kinase)
MTAAAPMEKFVHEAFLYSDEEEFVDGTVAFIEDGVADGEPVLVVLSAEKIERLRTALNGSADHVLFADMAGVGANPARIIAAWQQFVLEYGADGQPVRGIGEPVWAERKAHELAECQRHEELLNLAFADAPAFRLLCPYDTRALDESVIEEALRSHPYVSDGREPTESAQYRGLDQISAPFDRPLSEPPATAEELRFDMDTLPDVRGLVHRLAGAAAIEPARINSLVLSVNEIATNSVRHAGGKGILKVWEDGDALVCEVTDTGRIEEPLVGRRRPELDQPNGRGLWLANQLCDLVQVRAFENGGTVRIYMSRD